MLTQQIHTSIVTSAKLNLRRNEMSELDFKALELKVNQLIELSLSLEQKNKALLKELESIRQEKSKVIQQNDMARSKVEAMISRLKSLEH
jgi:cell division protein ZapB